MEFEALLGFESIPRNTITDYVSKPNACVKFDIPEYLIDYWIARKMVRIAELKSDGESKRVLYVNILDVADLKESQSEALELLKDSGDCIDFVSLTHLFPDFTDSVLKYFIREGILTSFPQSKDDWDTVILRRTEAEKVFIKYQEFRDHFNRVLSKLTDNVAMDILQRKIIFLRVYFNYFRVYDQSPITFTGPYFISVCRYPDTEWQYRESVLLVDIAINGELNSLIGRERLA